MACGLNRLYIFDKDGTLVRYNTAENRPANTPNEQILLPGVAEKISTLRSSGHKIAIATNQGGVAWGFITIGQAEALVLDAAEKIGGVDAWRVCPFDPKAAQKFPNKYSRDDASRKPHPGMLLSIMRQLGFDPAETIMVGDQESDRQAAEAAGCSFVWADEFFR